MAKNRDNHQENRAKEVTLGEVRKQAEELRELSILDTPEDNSIQAAITRQNKERRRRKETPPSQQPFNPVDEQQYDNPVDEQVKKEGFMDKVKAFFANLVAGIKSFFSGSEDIQPQSTKPNSADPDNQQEQAKQKEAQADKTVNSSKQQGHKDNETAMEAAEERGNKIGNLADRSNELAENSAEFRDNATRVKEDMQKDPLVRFYNWAAKGVAALFSRKEGTEASISNSGKTAQNHQEEQNREEAQGQDKGK
jgi:hypothetical protein